MEVCWRSSWLLLLLGVSLLATTLQGVQGEVESEGPSESECRPYIEKALKELETGEGGDTGTPDTDDSKEDIPTVEITTDDSDHQNGEGDDDSHEGNNESTESIEADQNVTGEEHSEQEGASNETADQDKSENDTDKSKEEEDDGSQEKASAEDGDDGNKSETDKVGDGDNDDTNEEQSTEQDSDKKSAEQGDDKDSKEESAEAEIVANLEAQPSDEDKNDTTEDSKEDDKDVKEDSKEDDNDTKEDSKEDDNNTKEDSKEDDKNDTEEDKSAEAVADTKSAEDDADSKKQESDEKSTEAKDDDDSKKQESDEKSAEAKDDDDKADSDEKSTEAKDDDDKTDSDEKDDKKDDDDDDDDDDDNKESDEDDDGGSAPEEELGGDIEIPTDLRDRNHVEHLLKLDDEASETEAIINRVAEITLRELKKLYENAIKPLEGVYKYRDLSNRHFGDAEIFSKPLILFMGPWSGGKSSIINYLLDNEYNETSLRTGAEPSPAYFNILMHGDEPEILDGTQLAADYTFSGLQKFGQGLEERLRGVRLPSELLEKVNIVEIPGILEVRKQVSRVFPFNDACQWFIDRADIIFLVYDPSKLDVGPETEAILDQLKGREHQTRIVLNKADQVKPEELMRVQGALIWNISPLMSSAQPPIMYTTSLWSRPYESWAPVRLLQAQERAFLRDLRSAVDKRIENKIASARRFAVRVRNHAKMVDCYLTTYYNHKSLFGNRKQVADEIIEHPQDYHIYEGLSTLTNISRYDLPDPEVYKDFFKLNPLYEFQQLSATCTYFRGCPINRLDIAIAYDLPELVGKHKRLLESALAEANQTPVPGS